MTSVAIKRLLCETGRSHHPLSINSFRGLMRRRHVPLWIVIAVTLCLCLRGILPGPAVAASHAPIVPISVAAHAVPSGSHEGCVSARLVPMSMPGERPVHPQGCSGHRQSSDCPLCPSALSALPGFLAAAAPMQHLHVSFGPAGYGAGEPVMRSGLGASPDDRPPRHLLTV